MRLSVYYFLCCGVAATALSHSGTLALLLIVPSSTAGFSSCHSSTAVLPDDGKSIVVRAMQRNVRPIDEAGHRSKSSNFWHTGFRNFVSLWTGMLVTSASMAGATTTLAVVVGEPTVPSISSGARLFQTNCAGCHGGGMNFIKEKKTLQKVALEKYLGGTDSIQIQKFVQGGMPHKLLPFAREFTDQDYANVASYVSDQATNEKW